MGGSTVIRKMGYEWHLRQIMATRGMFQTSDLLPLLEERGIHLSREQIYRLVTQPPRRLSMDTLAALCDILTCGPGELISVSVVNREVAKTGTTPSRERPPVRRTTIRRPKGL